MLAVDLADRSARAVLPSRVIKLGVTVDVLVNNAGFSTMGRVSDADPDIEMQMVEVDVVAVVDLCTRFIHGMVERGRGAILNVASTAAFQPLPGQAGYGAGKAFVLSYTQSLVGELKGSGVSATALCPGPVHTGFGERARLRQGGRREGAPLGDVGRRGRGRQGSGRGARQGPDGGHPGRREPGRRRDGPGHAADAPAPGAQDASRLEVSPA